MHEFPPKAFLKIKVNLESLYGTNILSILDAFYANISITLPKVDKDWFIFAVSLSLSFESTPVLPTHSLPAKSTKWILLYLKLVWETVTWIFWIKWIDTIVCERELL